VASKTEKGVILDELCATTGWHRNHARKALPQVGKLASYAWDSPTSLGVSAAPVGSLGVVACT